MTGIEFYKKYSDGFYDDTIADFKAYINDLEYCFTINYGNNITFLKYYDGDEVIQIKIPIKILNKEDIIIKEDISYLTDYIIPTIEEIINIQNILEHPISEAFFLSISQALLYGKPGVEYIIEQNGTPEHIYQILIDDFGKKLENSGYVYDYKNNGKFLIYLKE